MMNAENTPTLLKQLSLECRALRDVLLNQNIHSIQTKDNEFDNVVTELDQWVQNQLKQKILGLDPHANFLSEEDVNHQLYDRMWIIDPIDGTKNFIRRREDFAISIAYYVNQEPSFGLVYDVYKDIMYTAIVGHGAYLNDQPILKPTIESLQEAVIDVNLKSLYFLEKTFQSNVKAFSDQIFAHRNIGSAALSLCRIALGSHDVYISSHLKLWDYAASRIVLEEAGGVCYFPLQKAHQLNLDKTLIIACNSEVLYQKISAQLQLKKI